MPTIPAPVRRSLPSLLLLLLTAAPPTAAEKGAGAPPELTPHVTTLTETLEGAVGGVAVDKLGWIYVADFGNRVWRVSPWGDAEVFADGLYGSSGNTIDAEGRLLQASFHGGTLHRFDRTGRGEVVARGLAGPVGVNVDPASGDVIVCACKGNRLERVGEDGTVETFSESPLYQCPNGITRSADGTIWVVNFRNGSLLRVSATGDVEVAASLPGGGLGHVVAAGDHLYVTGFRANQVFRVAHDGTFEVLAGQGTFGTDDGTGSEATFANPNGIAYDANRDRLYTNDFLTPFLKRPTEAPRSTVRSLAFPSLTATLRTALETGGPSRIEETFASYRRRRSGYYAEIEANIVGYTLLQEGRAQDAVAVFEAVAAAYPNSFNAHDSLGEGLLAMGRQDDAIASYRRSIELNPGNLNGLEKLRELGAAP